MTQAHEQNICAFQTHDVRTPVMDHVTSPNDVEIEVKCMKTSAMSEKELQHLHCIQHMDSFQDALDPSECPIAITGHQLRRFDPDDIHYRFTVQWLNGDQTSVRSDALSLQHPDMVADYAVTKKLTSKPAFEWVSDYLESHRNIKANIVAMNSRAAQKIKFGIEVANNIKHALLLDKFNGDNVWKEAVDKELASLNSHKTFREFTEHDDISEYKKIPYHLVFDVKFDLRCKAHLVLQGNHVSPPKEDIYSGVVNMDSVRLAFEIAAMNGLSVCAADISTTFLHDKAREKFCIIAGKEFGELQGKPLIVDKSCCGLKSSAAVFYSHCSEKIQRKGFKPSRMDPDLCVH